LKPRLAVVGAGPAGVSAALWARDRFEVEVVERASHPGGQLRSIYFPPPELPGSDARDGLALAEICGRQLEQSGIQVRYGASATALERPRARAAVRGAALRLEGGDRIESDAILLATGLRRRTLDVPGESEFEGCGISTSATRDGPGLAGRDVLVVGGGDAAFENALRLADLGCRVTLAVRGRPRARREFQRRASGTPHITIEPRTRVVEFLGDQRLRAVRLEGPGGVRDRPFEGAVIKIGSIPNSEWCARVVRTDAGGFVRADGRGRTSVPRVWAAGDLVRPRLFAITVAAALGALAIQDAWDALGTAPRPAARRVAKPSTAPHGRSRARVRTRARGR
jgi:thioredoxin reductase (NADPH)